MRFLVKAKTIAISTILLAAMIFPTLATAQRSDLFFKVENDDIYNDRDFTFNLNVNGTGNEPFGVPLGSGLLVMTLAGAGYAVARRRRSLRKGTMLLLACALILGTTQCKKRIETITSNNVNTIQYTLNVGNGTRHIINPNENGYVPVRYDVNDVIYVGDGAKYLGYLTCITASDEHGNNAQFTGTIAEPSGNTLYFYFVGGLTPSVTLVENTTTEFTVDISDQGTKLPVLSMAAVTYDGATAADCTLRNKCALVEFKFTPGVATSKKVKISNMYTEAKIDFVNHSITHTEKLDAVNLYRANTTDNWAVLMYDNVVRKSLGMVYREHNTMYNVDLYDYYDGVVVPELSADTNYFYGSTAVSVNANASNLVNNEVFVVSANGNAVRFAPGNLMCTRIGDTWGGEGTYTWSFMENQYDIVETNNNSYCTDNYGNKDKVSLFGWGCTGKQDAMYNSNQQYYMPYNTIWPSGNVTRVYGPTGYHDLSVKNNSDWGAVIPNPEGYNWRLLTNEEWGYLLDNRSNASGKRAGAMVSPDYDPNQVPIQTSWTVVVSGMLIIPEGVSGSVIHSPQTAIVAKDNYFRTTEEMTAFLNSNNAVLLQFAGYRQAKKVTSQRSNGRYWTVNYDSDNLDYASFLSFGNGGTPSISNLYRAEGHSVRLVR